jgi:pilus assembly protein CpaB
VKARAALISVLVASVGALLVWMYLRRFEAEASGGTKIPVLMALRTVEPGTVLKDADIGERMIPQAYVETRAIRATDRTQVVNVRAAVPLQAQQSLMWTDIVVQNGDKTLSTLIQPGMRAVAVRADGRAQAIVRPGDRVDVIGTLTNVGNADNRASVVLLQNVLVLGRNAEPTAGHSGSEGSDLILSLTLQQAQIVAVAAEKGKLSVALRAPDDVRLVEGLTDVNSNTLAEPEKRAPLLAPKTGPIRFGDHRGIVGGGRP